MKYSFTAFHPPSKAVAQDARISSSETFLFMTSLSLCEPASGAKVSPLRLTLWTFFISSMEKLSALSEGRERLIFLGSHHSSKPSHSASSSR